MQFDELLAALTPDRYAVLKKSVELGKWPDGRVLSPDEREGALQVLIAYDIRHKAPEDRIGYVHHAKKTDCEIEHDHDKEDEINTNLIVKH